MLSLGRFVRCGMLPVLGGLVLALAVADNQNITKCTDSPNEHGDKQGRWCGRGSTQAEAYEAAAFGCPWASSCGDDCVAPTSCGEYTTYTDGNGQTEAPHCYYISNLGYWLCCYSPTGTWAHWCQCETE